MCVGEREQGKRIRGQVGKRERASNLVAALWSEVWQKRKRTSFRDFVKAYLLDMI